MRKRISLRDRIILILIILLSIILGGGSVMIWYTYRLEALFSYLIDKEMGAHRVVDALETDLANQKGFVSYFFIDGNPAWLTELEKYRRSFEENLKKAKEYTFTKTDEETVNKIESEYKEYIEVKYRVIDLYKAGEKEAGAQLHQDVRTLYFKILTLCDDYKNTYFNRINEIWNKSEAEAKHLRFIAGTAMSTAVLLSFLLSFILMVQVLGPVRRLTQEIDRSSSIGTTKNEVATLSNQVHDLIKDMEKFALVGKFAAGVAHSIRNPLTSVKMRLFSMERNMELSPNQKMDFEVISEEIRHINNIVQNFLEFSRPPKLKMRITSPSDVVDDSIRLLRDRLESYNVSIKLERKERLPELLADPEQLKEVLVNLLVNACEAMEDGGTITIHEEEAQEKNERAAIIRLIDQGPGIPLSIQGKIFQPFFTCKEDGTGLGLTIAARIINEHGGCLDLKSSEGEGAIFTIKLPLKREKNEHNSDC
ncbi:MAG: ATP-binding protein [bacterium]